VPKPKLTANANRKLVAHTDTEVECNASLLPTTAMVLVVD